MRKKEANPGIDEVVTSFQKSIKIIVSLRRKRYFANFPMEFSHKKCIHPKLEKSPCKRTENQCCMIFNLHFEPQPSMRRVPSWSVLHRVPNGAWRLKGRPKSQNVAHVHLRMSIRCLATGAADGPGPFVNETQGHTAR